MACQCEVSHRGRHGQASWPWHPHIGKGGTGGTGGTAGLPRREEQQRKLTLMVNSPNRIISASRRTDLPGYHADECAARLGRLRKPVHSVFFWTRYPRRLVAPGPLGDLVRWGIENPFVHLTLTGLGGSKLEPNVPPTAEVIAQLDGLLEALGAEPRRVLWRFDPVLVEAMTPDRFEVLARELGGRGVQTCTISFPALMSLKGSLAPTYQRHGLARHDRKVKRDLALRLAEVAGRHGLTVQACCQPKLVQDCGGAITPACCISAPLAVALHPRRLPLDLPRDPAQRRSCRCIKSDDIGKYTDRCASGCVYCYSSASD